MGAVAAAAAAAFAGGGLVDDIPSAAAGMIANGGGPGIMAQLHPKEMVLPAYLSEGFQRLLSDGEQGGGDTHTHYGDINAIDARGVREVLDAHADHIADLVMDQMATKGRRFRGSVG